jgi:phosphoglycerate dehydrogenase-like enzyme
MTGPTPPRIALAPSPSDVVVAAVQQGGGVVVGLADEPDALVWLGPTDVEGMVAAVRTAPSARWVQLPFAGVEAFAASLDPSRTWTCAKGSYAEPTAEHALALLLAGLRRLHVHAGASSWGEQGAASLFDAPVVVVGGGGITASLLLLLAPFRCDVTVVRRSAAPVAGATRTVPVEQLDEVLPGAAAVVLALALTPETHHLIGRRQLEVMSSSAWLVNIARGGHVDSYALADALRSGQIAGAAVDVTDPEPLPDDSPLWGLENCLITPHTANPWQTAQPLLARRVRENVQHFAAGEDLVGLVDLEAGY